MKQIENYNAEKYLTSAYKLVESGIYTGKENKHDVFVTSLSFIQEPELGENSDAGGISQYPLEDILEKFFCYVSDFYEEVNVRGSQKCYLEFASPDLEDIQKLRSIIGKHVYNRDEGEYVKLVIE